MDDRTYEDIVVLDVLQRNGASELVDESQEGDLGKHKRGQTSYMRDNGRIHTMTPYMAMPLARAVVWRHSTG